MSLAGIEQGISLVGRNHFRGLELKKELLNDGLSRMMWSVTFILNNDVVVTELCESPVTALAVAATAVKESK